MKKFWMVMREDGESASRIWQPKYTHDTRESADKEAERLTLKERVPFVVLECVGRCSLAKVQWEYPLSPFTISDLPPFTTPLTIEPPTEYTSYTDYEATPPLPPRS